MMNEQSLQKGNWSDTQPYSRNETYHAGQAELAWDSEITYTRMLLA
jgi:hypothetical protein